jgi:hypothetical protein
MGLRQNYFRPADMTPRRAIYPTAPPTPEPGLRCHGDEHRAGLPVGCDDGARTPTIDAQLVERWTDRDHKAKRDLQDESSLLFLEDKMEQAIRRREVTAAKRRAAKAAKEALEAKREAVRRVARAIRPLSIGAIRPHVVTGRSARPMPGHQGQPRRRHSAARIGTR